MSGIMSMLLGAVSSAAAAADEFFNRVTLLLNTSSTNGAQNNTFLDSSSNNFSITRNGNTTQGTFTPFSQTGWSVNFASGQSNYIQTPATVPSITGDYTAETWVYLTSLPNVGVIFSLNGSEFELWVNTNNTVSYYTPSATRITTTLTVPLNTWTHVALVRSSGVAKIYINGTADASTYSSSATIGSGTAFLYLGRDGGASGGLNGYISNARIAVGAAVYTSNFTPSIVPLGATTGGQNPPTGTQTYLLTCQSNRFVDNSPSPLTLTITGTPSVQAFSPFAPTAAYSTTTVGGSGYFDGTGDYLVFGSGQANANLNGNCSIELWFYPTGAAAAGLLTAKYGGTTNQFYVNSQSNNLIYCEFLGSTFYAKTSSGSFTRNAWNHLLITKSSTTAKMWLNGVYEGSWTVSTTNSSTDAIGVGATQGGATTFSGYISGIRYSNTATETGTSNITLPTAPLTSNGNTAALLSCTNAGIYDAAAKNNLETVGNAQVSTTQAKFGTTSMYFDGTGDWLYVPRWTGINANENLTIELFIYLTSAPANYRMMFADSNGNNSRYFAINSTGLEAQFGNTGSVSTSATCTHTFSQNTWYHIALVRNNGVVSMYVDGTSKTITNPNQSTAYLDQNSILNIGRWQGATTTYEFNGYMDEVRITKGVARYTANFTAPTAAFPVQ